jgi:hypothetical protein
MIERKTWIGWVPVVKPLGLAGLFKREPLADVDKARARWGLPSLPPQG